METPKGKKNSALSLFWYYLKDITTHCASAVIWREATGKGYYW